MLDLYGTYLRQLWKQKPQAWGPFSAVQSALFHNAEKIGIDPADILIAVHGWAPGSIQNYAQSRIQVDAGSITSFENNSLYFGSTAAYIKFPVSETPENFTFLAKFTPETLANYNNTLVNVSDSATTHGWGKFVLHGTSTGGVYCGTDKTKRFDPGDLGTVFSVGTPVSICYAFEKDVAATFYKDGVSLASTWHSTPTSWNDYYIGINSSDKLQGWVDYQLVFKTLLNSNQIDEITNNPWQLWQPTVNRSYFFIDDTQSGILPKLLINDGLVNAGLTKPRLIG